MSTNSVLLGIIISYFNNDLKVIFKAKRSSVSLTKLFYTQLDMQETTQLGILYITSKTKHFVTQESY